MNTNFRPIRLLSCAQVSLLTVGFLLAATTQAQTKYSLRDIGDFPGSFDSSRAIGLNDFGQVVGESVAKGNRRHAFLWEESDGSLLDLGDLPSGLDSSLAVAINNFGKVVGSSVVTSGSRAFYWTQREGMIAVGQVPGSAGDINNLGVIVLTANSRAFIFLDRQLIFLGSLPGGEGFSVATAINDLNVVVGYSDYSPVFGMGNHAFIWSKGVMTDIGDLSGGDRVSTALGINNLNEVCGMSFLPTHQQAYVWDSSNGMRALGEIPREEPNSTARAINDVGLIVGEQGAPSRYQAFVWHESFGMRNLNTLVDESGAGWNLTTAYDINETGQICGRGDCPNGPPHGFFMAPLDVVVPATVNVTNGIVTGGTVHDLAGSDDLNLEIDRDTDANALAVVVVVNSFSPIVTPDSLKFSLESSIGNRVSVTENIQLFNFASNKFESLLTKRSANLRDQVTTVSVKENVEDFIQPTTRKIQARIRYSTPIKNRHFSVRADEIMWDFR